MANLAIKGHSSRSNEVIEILEMLGGENEQCFHGGDTDAIYYIGNNKHIWVGIECQFCADFFYKITLEEFLEKYPYKVGDFVHIPEYESKVCICKIRWNSIYNYMEYMVYRDDTPEWYTVRVLLEYNESNNAEIMKETNKVIFEGNAQSCNIMNDIIKDNIEEAEEGVYAYNEINCYHQDFGDKVRIRLGGDFEIKVEDKLTYIVRKKPQYPDNYEECCSVLGMTYDYPDIRMVSCEEFNLYSSFIQLIRCRNAYWKIAGKEMGLGKPWKPVFESNDEGKWQERYGIYIAENKIEKDCWGGGDINIILTFPTEEMRDAFFENFKDLIEICKELL